MRALILLALLITVSPPADGTRWHKRFVFLVDTSGSMSGDKTGQAIEAFLEIAQQPTDDMAMTIYSFDDKPKEWKRKWVKLPDAKAIADATTFLNQANRWSGTQLIPALEKVLTQKGQFNLIIVGDGQYLQESTSNLLKALKPFKARKVLVSVVSVGPVTEQAKAIATFCGGGLFQIAPNGQDNGR